ncbi:tRNA (guanosine(46)-N7)-methyltransferase TrmB [Lactobacillus mulieris]|uniref:tRNA (guanosine(46)-N7)-methyltransferase TrmB n=1 Tax=Lactobacillus mulieris TaxID=2508708 RepID=UPI0014329637|nr:tRNA (guanosine(46)-N7)-methyltransferase TrmB [Lactobacillus mulieris]MCF1784162.1 tRNA (guanosine(46)-N7)-methyltransferase TrmB [Lactobacillus mulieris]MCW8104928.1 tRNA (guanosine(46)-N7)-methyltransferase TrmB [Lactobacillus mulieris]MDK6803606.1 tRNA (guanosine(46)-N7)-methyltransferase TrmB [Lactobacillus mulieris]MDK8382765.1 tRNA (guanosine(46)-N7)-methyltransferase TrmB [Lactobacillus mulieris]MDT9620946.1 tRNA (guanosine(46)-N7)-methyltransferase TrmB [Lactobacillus mulieris]
MRLRNKPWAVKLVDEHPESVLQDPNPEINIDWEKRFEDFSRPLEVEIGSGKGQFITTLAQKHPDRNYVAIELQTTAAGIILRTKLEKKLDNLQILRGDAISIASFFAENSVDVLYLNFSDPWPKTRHEKRRLTYKDFLKNYETILKPAGHLEFKTDNSGLFSYSLMSLNNYGMTFDFVSVDLHHESEEIVAKNVETEYEHKFASKGNPIYALHAHFN